MPTYFLHEDFVAHERLVGHPTDELPLVIREAYAIAGRPVPRLNRSLSVHTPPPPGQCAHCGRPCGEEQHLAAHAVAGFEDAHHLASGELLRMLVTHCDEHWQGDHCARNRVTPGSGWLARPAEDGSGVVGPGGYCESLEQAQTAGMVLIPGALQLARWSARVFTWALASMGLYLLSNGIVTSQGQQVANLGGPLANLIVPGDATADHGFNAGLLRVLTGAAPGSGASAANAAETGTLLINWSMPATAFGAATAATPSVTTANAISNVNASATGTAGYARLVQNSDAFGLSTTIRRFQMTVGAGSGELSFNTLAISSGGACSCTSFTITHGA